MDVAPKHHEQYRARPCEDIDPQVVNQSVAAVGKTSRHVAVAGHERRKPWEVLVGGIGRQEQNGHGCGLQQVVERALAEHRAPELA
ncbi:MAG: hypothetical protein IMX00_00190 [Limnochordales bacterium]|nr:hypothetical protein [Limnochordales bacterium]